MSSEQGSNSNHHSQSSRTRGSARGSGVGRGRGYVASDGDARGEDNFPTANRSHSSRDNDNGGRGAANGRGGSWHGVHVSKLNSNINNNSINNNLNIHLHPIYQDSSEVKAMIGDHTSSSNSRNMQIQYIMRIIAKWVCQVVE